MTKREREVTDVNELIDILNTCKVLHLGLVDDGMPYIVPMNYGYTMEDGNLTLYLHGAATGYKLDVIRKNPVCCFEMECDVRPFEGKMACQYGTVYRSIMGRGTVEIIDDVDQKREALTLFMKTQTDKAFEFDEKMVSIVSVMKINVSEFTGKKRPLPAALEE